MSNRRTPRSNRMATLPPIMFTLEPSHAPSWAERAFGTRFPDEVIAWMRRAGFVLGSCARPDERAWFLGIVDAEETYGVVRHNGDVVVSHGDSFVGFLTAQAEAQQATRRPPRDLEHVLEQLRGQVKPGVISVAVAHDDTCRIWKTQRAADCDCTPDVSARPVAPPKKGGRA
jgi:hypothetical protein